MVKFNKAMLGGSVILLITFNIFNFLNFLFQFSMARLLTAVEYGVLATLFSMIYVSSIFSESIQTIVTKYAATESRLGKLNALLRRSLTTSGTAGFALFALYLLLAIPLAYLLKIEYPLLALNGLIILIAFTLPVTRGILQGRKQFTALGLNFIIEAGAKILLAIALVLLLVSPFKVYGAVIALVIGGALAFWFSYSSLREIRSSPEQPLVTKALYSQVLPIFFMTLAVVGFYSIDIIIARIVFTEEVAGYYAIAAVLAKALFWGTLPISKAMFPLAADKRPQKKKKNSSIFGNALTLLILCCGAALTFIYFFPAQIISLFSGKQLVPSAQILFSLALAMSLLALSNLLLLYKLAQKKFQTLKETLFFASVLFLGLLIEVLLLATSGGELTVFAHRLILSALVFLVISGGLLKFSKS